MNRFYRVAITKRPIGSAIEHKEPAVQGSITAKVADSTTSGDYAIFVVDCDDAQNEANLSNPEIEELSEGQAVELAAKYQPARTLTQLNPRTMEEEKIDVPACDLEKYYKAAPEDSSVVDVPGIGQSTKKALESIQIRTIAELADSKVEILKSAGINEERARNIIAEANRVLGREISE